MDNKELMELIEQYGQAREDLGWHNAASYLSNPQRIKALIDACKAIAKIEREILREKKNA